MHSLTGNSVVCFSAELDLKFEFAVLLNRDRRGGCGACFVYHSIDANIVVSLDRFWIFSNMIAHGPLKNWG